MRTSDFGLLDPEGDRGSSPKLKSLVPGPCPTSPKKFRQNPFTTFSVIRRTQTARVTARQTDGTKNITSFGGGNNNNKISSGTEDTRETMFLFQRLSVAPQRGNAVSFLATFANSEM